MSYTDSNNPRWAELLRRAVTEPGIISQAFTRFHNYSMGNQLLAWCQCESRGIAPGPIATYPRWKELGRHVIKGAKAITLCIARDRKRTTPNARTMRPGRMKRSRSGTRGLCTRTIGLCCRKPMERNTSPNPSQDGIRTPHYPHSVSNARRSR